MIDRAALMLDDVRRSADSLAALLDRADRPLVVDPGNPIELVGLGSSRFAALTVAAALRSQGRLVEVLSASVGLPQRAGSWRFAISSSGRTPETVDAAQAGGKRTIAVTNDPASPLAAAAGRVLELEAGRELGGVATLTYRATIAQLALATGAATPDELQRAVAAIRAVLEGDPADLDRAAEVLDGAPSIDVVADAPRIGSAEQAALLFREAPRLRAEARDAGEWAHTAIYTALPGHRLVLLGPGRYAGEVASTALGRGATVVGIGVELPGLESVVRLSLDPSSGAVVRALVESVAIELLAVRLWVRAAEVRAT